MSGIIFRVETCELCDRETADAHDRKVTAAYADIKQMVGETYFQLTLLSIDASTTGTSGGAFYLEKERNCYKKPAVSRRLFSQPVISTWSVICESLFVLS